MIAVASITPWQAAAVCRPAPAPAPAPDPAPCPQLVASVVALSMPLLARALQQHADTYCSLALGLC